MGWVEPERGRSSVVGASRRSTVPLQRVPAHALRGATTLEQQTLPLAIVASFATLAAIQLVLTW
jgi:hypothetical protein